MESAPTLSKLATTIEKSKDQLLEEARASLDRIKKIENLKPVMENVKQGLLKKYPELAAEYPELVNSTEPHQGELMESFLEREYGEKLTAEPAPTGPITPLGGSSSELATKPAPAEPSPTKLAEQTVPLATAAPENASGSAVPETITPDTATEFGPQTDPNYAPFVSMEAKQEAEFAASESKLTMDQMRIRYAKAFFARDQIGKENSWLRKKIGMNTNTESGMDPAQAGIAYEKRLDALRTAAEEGKTGFEKYEAGLAAVNKEKKQLYVEIMQLQNEDTKRLMKKSFEKAASTTGLTIGYIVLLGAIGLEKGLKGIGRAAKFVGEKAMQAGESIAQNRSEAWMKLKKKFGRERDPITVTGTAKEWSTGVTPPKKAEYAKVDAEEAEKKKLAEGEKKLKEFSKTTSSEQIEAFPGLNFRKAQIIETTIGKKLEGETLKAWEKMKILGTDRFMKPEKYPWKFTENGEEKTVPAGKMNVKNFPFPNAERLQQTFKPAYEKLVSEGKILYGTTLDAFMTIAIQEGRI